MYAAAALMVARIRADRERLLAVNPRLQELLAREERLARTDPLTGLSNIRAVLERLMAELARARREKRPLALLCVDLDGFKRANDALGHAASDAVLKSVADALRESIRAEDAASRIGGDEFVVVLGGAGQDDAQRVASRIVERGTRVETGKADIGVSVSVGGVLWDGREDAEALLRRGDGALYDAKVAGGGWLIFYPRGEEAAAPD